MVHQILKDKPTKLFVGIAAFFVANAIIANCIGGKIISFEKIIGINPSNFTLFGQSGIAINLTCGVLLWPLEFIITDIVNEYYGPKAVRRISITAVVLIIYAFTMFYLAMQMPAADFWYGSKQADGVQNMGNAFNAVFGQGMWIILGSVVAFFVSQVVDVTVFHKIKQATGEKRLWLRATGSTFISQFVDSFLVLFIAFYIGNNWSFQLVLAICIVNYIYKICVAIILTPVVYLLEKVMDNYVGKQQAADMKRAAMNS
jgi:queuosine precursor transporter